ncbi:MAG TPA: hypothetical protein PLR82_05375 [Bacillota bacterium]|nr:hypothetical protein [Bacillota bacterium]HQD86494.1 hypothetical protein [Bacillota bacterium]
MTSDKKPRCRHCVKLPTDCLGFLNPHRNGRKSCHTEQDAVQGTISGDELDFILAWDAAERQVGRRLRKTEVLQIFRSLGYVSQADASARYEAGYDDGYTAGLADREVRGVA